MVQCGTQQGFDHDGDSSVGSMYPVDDLLSRSHPAPSFLGCPGMNLVVLEEPLGLPGFLYGVLYCVEVLPCRPLCGQPPLTLVSSLPAGQNCTCTTWRTVAPSAWVCGPR